MPEIDPPRRATLLVLADLDRETLTGLAGEAQRARWSAVANCRMALLGARLREMSVAFTRRRGRYRDSPLLSTSAWIAGFEPQRLDAVFEREQGSCYANPFFREIVDANGGVFVLGGLLSDADRLATSTDAARCSHRFILLADATLPAAVGMLADPIVDVRMTEAWLGATVPGTGHGSQD